MKKNLEAIHTLATDLQAQANFLAKAGDATVEQLQQNNQWIDQAINLLNIKKTDIENAVNKAKEEIADVLSKLTADLRTIQNDNKSTIEKLKGVSDASTDNT